ncbi:chemotaxis protein CheW [Schauerella aestuarii]|uniref:chemotaxis protein CheW n=1 Tax=Schauerella aestuarii TaxID=2511204 RepID=UPI00136CE028|nr:chemotaxis protein CheW [Achromobacter aestuarii]MYZ44529.1 chemotaxis protein CheW [Achromobacter aestuarii]
MAAFAPTAFGAAARANAGRRKLFLRFRIGRDGYVLAADDIVRVLPLSPVKALPGTPAWVEGLMSVGTRAIPVIDVSALASGVPSPRLTSTRIAVVRYTFDGRAAATAPLLGLMLEHATETLHLNADEFVPAAVQSHCAPYLGPVCQTASGLVQWLELPDVVPPSARALLFTEHPA